jgi:superfamily II DNA/RNA helicase
MGRRYHTFSPFEALGLQPVETGGKTGGVSQDSDIELRFYERFFLEPGLEPYPVQEEAMGHIFAGKDVLVTVPTGTGKTLIAKAALYRALQMGRRAIYTTPLRALTEEKHRELCHAFGEENVGFATGDYQVRPEAPVQVVVAEILWNRIFGQPGRPPADVVVMDEAHYFNDPERGYVWEQSIIGLHPESQLILLSATVGSASAFSQWVYTVRRVPMHLVTSTDRKVPLLHEFRDSYLIEVVKDLFGQKDVPALIFCFGRTQCFEQARLLKRCRRFVDDDELEVIRARSQGVLLPIGFGKDLLSLLEHGVGVHHAGVLPAYRELVENLTADRLLKFVVTTETIAAGINLPAKRVVFPSLRKFIGGKARLLLPSEYHQMAGRAGRPQFDTEGLAITLAPEEVIQDFRKEAKDLARGGALVDENRIKKKHYQKRMTEARAKNDVSWDPESHRTLVSGEPAALSSRTKVSADQILAIGLPEAKGSIEDPGSMNIQTVIERLLCPEPDKRAALKRLEQIAANMRALGVLDADGHQVRGELIRELRGVDGLFVYQVLMDRPPDYLFARELLEFVVDHEAVQRHFDKKAEVIRRAWIREKLGQLRREDPQATWEDAEALYAEAHPPELSEVERLHQAFQAKLPHPELHGGKRQKLIFASMEDSQVGFMDYVLEHGLTMEEGSLFTYLARLTRTARMLFEASNIGIFEALEQSLRSVLAPVDRRVIRESASTGG